MLETSNELIDAATGSQDDANCTNPTEIDDYGLDNQMANPNYEMKMKKHKIVVDKKKKRARKKGKAGTFDAAETTAAINEFLVKHTGSNDKKD